MEEKLSYNLYPVGNENMFESSKMSIPNVMNYVFREGVYSFHQHEITEVMSMQEIHHKFSKQTVE